MTQYLLDDGLPQSYIDELFAAHPELQEQKTDGASGQSSITISYVYVNGKLDVNAPDGKKVPAAKVPFCIYDVDLSTNSSTLLRYAGSPACGYTSSSGHFGMTIIQDDPDDDTNVDLQVAYTLDGRFSKVTKDGSEDYTLKSKIAENVDSGRHTHFTTANDDDNFRRAYWIYDAMYNGADVLNDNLGIKVPKVTVKWEPNKVRGTVYSKDTEIITIGNENPFKIKFAGEAYPNVIMHEYGHFIMHKLYERQDGKMPDNSCKQYYDDTGVDHSPQVRTTEQCAWTEGWAHFVAAAALKSPIVNYHIYKFPFDLETRKWDYNSETGTSTFFATGPKVEGNVAGLLWDIHDGKGEDGQDDIKSENRALLKVFASKPDSSGVIAETVSDFHSDWQSHSKISITNILKLNKLSHLSQNPFADFLASLKSSSVIEIVFSKKVSQSMSSADFGLSHGVITSVTNFDNSTKRHLHVTGIPHETAVTVTYKGPSLIMSDGSILKSGTSSKTKPLSKPDIAPVISDISDVVMNAGQTRQVIVSASDADGDDISLKLTGAVPSFAALADRSGGKGTITLSPAASDAGVHVVTVQATANGKTDTESFKVTVRQAPADTTPPVIAAPADIIVEATGPRTTVTLGTPTVSDNIDSNPKVANNAPASFALGTTTITWTATDAAGNRATDTQRVTVRDTAPPTFSGAPSGITITVASHLDSSTVTFGTPTATDLVDGAITVKTSHASGSQFSVGTTTVTFTATDSSGNTARHSIAVMVVRDQAPVDTTPPVISAPADMTAEATGRLTALSALGTPTVSDNVDSSPKVTNNAPSSFGLGTTTVTWTAIDAAGNRATDTQRVTIRDTAPPVFSNVPLDITVRIAPNINSSAVTFGNPVATDLVDGVVAVNTSHTSGSQFSVGNTTVTFTATDSSGNAARHTVTIVVVHDYTIDFTPPTVAAPDDILAEATGRLTVFAPLGTPVVSDDVDSNPVVTNNAPAAFPLGTTVVTWTATDAAGNMGHDAQLVTMEDTTPPAFTSVPSDITAEVDGTGTYVNYRPPTAHDTVDKARPVTTTPPPGAWFAIGTHTVTFAASDKSDNTATAHMTITIKQTPDTTSPRITAPPDVTVEATGSHTEVRLGTPRVSDNRDHSPTVTNNAPASFPLGTTIITWTAVDDAGNRATDTQRVTIRDTTPPAFANMPADITKYVDLPQAISEDYGVPVEFDAPTATDLVDGPVSVHGSHESGAKFRPGSTTVMWNATDSAGNTATTSITINIYSNIRKETLDLINDRFDNGLDDWAYTEKPYPRYNQIFCGMVAEFHNYNITYSTEHGGSMHLSESDIDACWLGTAGPVKRFTMPPTHRDGAASVYLEYRSLADLSNNTRGLPINTALVMITDANYKVIKHERLYNAAVEDSGWLNKTIQLGPLGKKCPCEIFIYTLDAWWDGPWDHQLYVDNLQVTVSPPPEPDGVSGASAPTGIMYGALYKQDLLEMLSHEGARIIISDVQVSSDAMTIQWEPFASLGSNDKSNGDKTTKYRIVLHPAGNSDEKISILTADTQHRFDGLEPDTNYNLRVRVAGDHDTQSALDVRTAGAQIHP